MAGKTPTAYVLLLLFILLFSLPFAHAPGKDDDWGGQSNKQGSGEGDKLQDALSNQGDYSGSVPGNTEAKLSNGQTAAVSGNVVVSGGEIKSADSIAYQGASISNAQDFQAAGDGFSLGYAARLSLNANIIQGGSGIVYSNGILSAASYDSFTSTISFTTAGTGLNATVNEITVASAETFTSGDITFSNIPETNFQIYTDAVIAKPSIGTNLTIKDADGNEVIFEATGNASNVTVFQSRPARYIIARGILKHSRDNITESVIGNNTIVVDVGLLGFRCMQITPIGSYYFNENTEKDFGINIPIENEDEYILCLRKLPGEEFVDDGEVDFVDNKIKLNKIANYIRYSFDDDNMFSLFSENVYESNSKNNSLKMNLDENMLYIKLFNLSSGLSDENISVTRFGRQEIIETSGSRLARILFNKTYPNVINRYATNFSDAVIDIKGKTLTQTGNTKVKILSPGDEDVEKAEIFLLNYWNRYVKTLMDYLGG